MLPITKIKHQFYVHRDDLNHEFVSGNKLHKLQPNIDLAIDTNKDTLLSFGGPYSNHLHALAYACKIYQLSSVGVIRGELKASLTPTLRDCRDWGMQLYECSRNDFRSLRNIVEKLGPQEALPRVKQTLASLSAVEEKNTILIPEGGSNKSAIQSLANAYAPLFEDPKYRNVSYAVCATGTGATVAGLKQAAPNHVKVIGIQAVAEGVATETRIKSWIDQVKTGIEIQEGHLGGFGKSSRELDEFIAAFEQQWGIPLDSIYNGKVFYHLNNLVAKNYFKTTDRVLVVHTGGLQGKRT
ncbi:MAG: pyridoxal-phosphate dependent enzyme [Gammaproteobacteria bacterium]|nr:pyridoxal-phosphate dependent enzyme [Gammaproteobacteria bacterium]